MKGTRISVPMTTAIAMLVAFSTPSIVWSKDKTPAPGKAKPAANKAKPTAGKATSVGDDEAAIRKSAEGFVAAFNRHDAKALAEMWTTDGEYIDEAGQKFQGRQAIAEEYAQFFQANQDVKLHVSIDAIRLISPTTAIEDGHASLAPLPNGAPGGSRYTAIHVKDHGRWMLASVRDTRLETPSTYAHLQDLEWLVGDWTAEHLGRRADVNCRWIAQKSYLQRIFTVTRKGHVVSSSTEIIGWDPQSGSVKSWTFSSGGGHAVGVWRPIDGGWIIAADGLTADGTVTKAVNTWVRLAGDALGWGSTERSAGGAELGDPRELVLKRAEPAAADR